MPFKHFLTGEKRAEIYAQLAARLQTTEGALKRAVRRMLDRYRELLHEEVANTVSGPEEIEGEMRAVFAALR